MRISTTKVHGLSEEDLVEAEDTGLSVEDLVEAEEEDEIEWVIIVEVVLGIWNSNHNN